MERSEDEAGILYTVEKGFVLQSKSEHSEKFVAALRDDIPSSAEVTKTKPVVKQCYILPLAGNCCTMEVTYVYILHQTFSTDGI